MGNDCQRVTAQAVYVNGIKKGRASMLNDVCGHIKSLAQQEINMVENTAGEQGDSFKVAVWSELLVLLRNKFDREETDGE
jgi:hypothetical protein